MKRRSQWLLMALLPVLAAAQDGNAAQPEIQRQPGTAQAVGVLHTVRQIPEACTRIDGRFTGQAGAPYELHMAPTNAQCRPRALVVDFAQVQANEAAWKLNDRIRIPAIACPGQQAVIEVWRLPVEQPLQRDAQGRVRVYLNDTRQQAKAGQLAQLPAYAVQLHMEGASCR